MGLKSCSQTRPAKVVGSRSLFHLIRKVKIYIYIYISPPSSSRMGFMTNYLYLTIWCMVNKIWPTWSLNCEKNFFTWMKLQNCWKGSQIEIQNYFQSRFCFSNSLNNLITQSSIYPKGTIFAIRVKIGALSVIFTEYSQRFQVLVYLLVT